MQQQQGSLMDVVAPAAASYGAYQVGNYLFDAAGNAIGSALAPAVPEIISVTSQAGAAAPALAMNSGNTVGSALPTTVLGDTLGATFGNALGVAGGLYSAYNIADKFGEMDPISGALSGAGVAGGIGGLGALAGGSLAPLALAGGPIGLGVGAALGLGLSAIKKSGKDKDQKLRDKVRGSLKKGGVIDTDNNIVLADGTKYDIGIDGKDKPFNVDTSRDYALDARGWAIPLGYLSGGGDQKVTEDFAGYITNAAISNAKDLETAQANVQAVADKFGGADAIKASLADLLANEKIDQHKYDAAIGGVDSLYGTAQKKEEPKQQSKPKPKTQAAAVEVPLTPPIDMTQNYIPKPLTPGTMPGDVMAAPPMWKGAGNYADLLRSLAQQTGARYI